MRHCKILPLKMTGNQEKNFEQAIGLLEQIGLLLVRGTEIPDVCRIVTGQEFKGSWWSNPAAHQIFAVNERLADHPDVTLAKLVSGKVTFIHRKLWPQLFTLGTQRSDWQLSDLSTKAKQLLKTLDTKATLVSTALGPKPGDVVRELELKLLVHTDQVHTDKGSHAKILETWEAWAKRVDFKPKRSNITTAQNFFEKRVDEINQQYGGRARLPWQAKRS